MAKVRYFGTKAKILISHARMCNVSFCAKDLFFACSIFLYSRLLCQSFQLFTAYSLGFNATAIVLHFIMFGIVVVVGLIYATWCAVLACAMISLFNFVNFAFSIIFLLFFFVTHATRATWFRIGCCITVDYDSRLICLK